MDGTDYTQSTALLRYAGKLGGTYPKCPLAALKVDEIVMIAEDVFINLFSTLGEKDEAKKVNESTHGRCNEDLYGSTTGNRNDTGNRNNNGNGNKVSQGNGTLSLIHI